MIRKFDLKDIDIIMKIWIDTNIKAHSFIKESYWIDNLENVKSILPNAEIYVYVDEYDKKIKAFVGMNKNYLEGIFVLEEEQSKGIGKQLLNYIKNIRDIVNLNVYKDNQRAIKFYETEGFIIKFDDIDESTGKCQYFMEWNKKN